METVFSEELSLALAGLPEGLRPSVTSWLDRCEISDAGFTARPEALDLLLRLVACSEFAASTLRREWDWFLDNAADLSAPPSAEDLEQFTGAIAASDEPVETVRKALREYRHRYLVRVLWRELAGAARLEDTLHDLSRLADKLLSAAAIYAERRVEEKYGRVRDGEGGPVPLVVLGMGKLGGRELNFSSDIDLVFLYPEGRESDGDRRLSAQEYFARVARQVIALLDEVTEDGSAMT